MTARYWINRLLILGFLFLIGYMIASSIAYKSAAGLILALVSLVCTVYFLYLLASKQQEAAANAVDAEADELA